MRQYYLVLILVSIPLSAGNSPQTPTDKIPKNKEYVCVKWTGSSDPSQNQPSVCLQWELRDKPWNRRSS